MALIGSTAWVKVHDAIAATANATIAASVAGLGAPENSHRHEAAVSIAAAAGGVWTVKFQHSPDGGTTWVDCDTSGAVTTLTADAGTNVSDTIHYEGGPKANLRVRAIEDTNGTTCTVWVIQYDARGVL